MTEAPGAREPVAPSSPLAELDRCLAEQLSALDRLAAALHAEHEVLAAGDHAGLAAASAASAEAFAAAEGLERRRAALTEQAAAGLGLPVAVTLAVLAEHAGTEWSVPLRARREALLGAAGTVAELAGSVRGLLARGLTAVTDALTLLGAAPVGYDADGHQTGARVPSRGLDARV